MTYPFLYIFLTYLLLDLALHHFLILKKDHVLKGFLYLTWNHPLLFRMT